MCRILQNDTALKGEDQHQRQKQADGGDAIEFSDKGGFKIVLSVLSDDQETGQHTAGQRNDHKQDDREDQRIPGYGYIGNA